MHPVSDLRREPSFRQALVRRRCVSVRRRHVHRGGELGFPKILRLNLFQCRIRPMGPRESSIIQLARPEPSRSERAHRWRDTGLARVLRCRGLSLEPAGISMSEIDGGYSRPRRGQLDAGLVKNCSGCVKTIVINSGPAPGWQSANTSWKQSDYKHFQWVSDQRWSPRERFERKLEQRRAKDLTRNARLPLDNVPIPVCTCDPTSKEWLS